MIPLKEFSPGLTTDGLIATVLLSENGVEITKSISKAAVLISKISIFQMHTSLVHSYAQLDCMLHGQIPVKSWETAIGLLDSLKSGDCPKKALIEEAKELLISEQMAFAMKNGAPTMKTAPTVAVSFAAPNQNGDTWDTPGGTPAWVQKMADTKDPPSKVAKKVSFTAPEGPAFTNEAALAELAAHSTFATSKQKYVSPTNIPNIQQMPATAPIPATIDFKAIKGCAIQVHAHGVFVKTPFNPQFVQAIKTLPVSDRKWDTAKGVWVVSLAHKNWVMSLMEQSFPGKVQELTA